MAVIINGDTGISPVTASGTSASVDGMTVGRGGGEVATNTAVGTSAIAATATATRSTAIGYQALTALTSGDPNTAVGAYALKANTVGAGNVGVGAYALQTNISGALNTAVGNEALSLNTGNYNTAIGGQALTSNTTASNNTAVGYQALYSNVGGNGTTAATNTAIGNQALYSNTIGYGAVSIGYQAGYTNITGALNTFLGNQAGYFTTSSNNTFLGATAGYAVTSGAKNTIIGEYNGNQGGLDIRTSSNRIVLSDGDGNPRGVFSNDGELYVGITTKAGGVANAWYQATTTDSKSAIAVSAHVNGANAINWYNASSSYLGSITLNASTVTYGGTSDYRLKENVAPMINALAKVQALKPCTFTWKNSGEDGDGFLAHELQEVCPNAVSGEKDAVNEDGSIRPQQVDTSYVVATLTAAIQELKAEFDAYKATHP